MLPDELDHDRLAEATLALLSLTIHDHGRVWKALDWDLMNLLHEKGWITDPRNKAKSVLLTVEGERLATGFLEKHFARRPKKRIGKPKRLPSSGKGHEDVPIDANTHVIRCTAKLLKELGVSPVETVPDEIDLSRQWHANLLRLERRKCLLFTHSITLYSFMIMGVRRTDFNRFDAMFAENLLANLRAEGFSGAYISDLAQNTPHVMIAKTNDRSVLGSMNDLAFQAQVTIEMHGGMAGCDVLSLNHDLNQTLMGALQYGRPIEAMKHLLSVQDTESI